MLKGPLRELAGLFLRLGCTAFGGPAAHIAMMEEEVVRRKQWMTRQEFLDLLGATNLIPGPNSTEMAIHIGYRRGGWPGLLVAGACFIVPATILVGCLAWAYVTFGKLPQAAALLYGVKPVVFAIVVQAMWRLARMAVKTPLLGVVGVASLGFILMGASELAILAAAGTLLGFVGWFRSRGARRVTTALVLGAMALVTVAAEFVPTTWLYRRPPARTVGALFLYFAKIGSVLYGSGYVLLAFLQTDLVAHWHWLTARQLLDAVAAGQVTPGPVFTTATFIGYILAGPAGAACATLGIFLPAFFFCAISGPLVPRVRRSAVAGAFLDGVNVASLALMAGVTWALARAAVIDVVTVVLAVVSALILFRYRVNSGWLVLGGAAVGLVLTPFVAHAASANALGSTFPEEQVVGRHGESKHLSDLWREKPLVLVPLEPCDAPLPKIDDSRVNIAGIAELHCNRPAVFFDAHRLESPVLLDNNGVLRRVFRTADSIPGEVRAWFAGMGVYRARCARCHGVDGGDTGYPGIRVLRGIGNRHCEDETLDMTQRAGFVDLHSLDEKSRRALAIYVAGL